MRRSGRRTGGDDCSVQCARESGNLSAARDVEARILSVQIEDVDCSAEVNVTGLTGYLLAKAVAAHSRRQTKDWYDIAFPLLHNDADGPAAAAELAQDRFPDEAAAMALRDLRVNFETPDAQEPRACVHDHPDSSVLAVDAALAVQEFRRDLQRQART